MERTLLSVAFDVDLEVDLDSDAAAALIEGIGSGRARPSVVTKADTTVKERRFSAALSKQGGAGLQACVKKASKSNRGFSPRSH